MKILHIIPWYGGGIASLVKKLVTWAPENVKSTIATFNSSEEFKSRMESIGVKVIQLSPKEKVGFIRYCYGLYEILMRGKYDIVHIHLGYKSYLAILLSSIAGVKVIACHAHAANFGRPPSVFNKIELILSRWLSRILCKRLFTCSDLAARFLYGNLKDNRIKLIKNAVNVNIFSGLTLEEYRNLRAELEADGDVLLIGHIGQFCYAKNHEFILKIAQALKEKGIKYKLFFAGEGILRKEIEKQVQIKGLNNYILFLGYRNDVQNLLKACDVFIFPSHYEGLPTVIIEAQASNLPCVLSDTITKQCDLKLGLLKFLSLDDSPDKWADTLVHMALNRKNYDLEWLRSRIEEEGFIDKEVANMYYRDLEDIL